MLQRAAHTRRGGVACRGSSPSRVEIPCPARAALACAQHCCARSRIVSPTGAIAKASYSRAIWPSGVSTLSSSKRPSSVAIAIFISSSAR